jgi:hypothetical protein
MEFCFQVAHDIAKCIDVGKECGGLSIVKIDGEEKCSACEAAATIVDHVEMLSRNALCSFRATTMRHFIVFGKQTFRTCVSNILGNRASTISLPITSLAKTVSRNTSSVSASNANFETGQ